MTTRIDVVGGGQLGRMMALAGARLGMSFVFLARKSDGEGLNCKIAAEFVMRKVTAAFENIYTERLMLFIFDD